MTAAFNPSWELSAASADRKQVEEWLCRDGGAAKSLASRSINGLRHRGCVTVQNVLDLLMADTALSAGDYWFGKRSEAVWRKALGLPTAPGEARCPTCGHKL